MVIDMTKRVMLNGIRKYAKKFERDTQEIQLRVSMTEAGELKYQVYENYKQKEDIQFKDILKSPFDIMGYERMSTPVFQKALIEYAVKHEREATEMCLFIVEHNGKILLPIYAGNEHKDTVSLELYLEEVLKSEIGK